MPSSVQTILLCCIATTFTLANLASASFQTHTQMQSPVNRDQGQGLQALEGRTPRYLSLLGGKVFTNDNEEFQRRIHSEAVEDELELVEKCEHKEELLANYSTASSMFMECTICNAKPVLFCGHCVYEYDRLDQAWEAINNDVDCKKDILVSDKLQIVKKTQYFLEDLWKNGGECQKCYDQSNSFKPKNSTVQFLDQYEITVTCFMNYSGSYDFSQLGGNKTSPLCTNCSDEYTALNNMYEKMPDADLCMDILDLMNRTRAEWKNNNCTRHCHAYVPVIAISFFVCVLPFFFYLTAALHGTKKKHKLVGTEGFT